MQHEEASGALEIGQHEGQRLAAGALYVALKKYKRPNPVTLSPPSIDTPGEETHLLVEIRFEDALKRERSELTEKEKMEEALTE